MPLSLLLATLLVAQDVQGPKLDTPRSLLSCGTDSSLESALCRATVTAEQKRYGEAASLFEQAAALAGDDREQRARIELAAANMWLADGRAANADTAIARALEFDLYLSPLQRGLARIDRARAAQAMDDDARAIVLLSDAAQFADQDPFLWWMKGSLELDMGDLAAARASLDKGLALADDAPELLFLAGQLAMAEGNETEARARWTAAASHLGNPSAEAATAALAELSVEPPQ